MLPDFDTVVLVYQLHIFRPLLKLVDRLLLVGMLRDEDVNKLLIMIHPETWDETFDKGIDKFV